jgi:hypothetical protein
VLEVLSSKVGLRFRYDVLIVGEVAVLFYDSFTKKLPGVYRSEYLAVRSVKVG